MQAAVVGPQQAYREQLQALPTRVATLMTLSKSSDTVMRTTGQSPSLLLDQNDEPQQSTLERVFTQTSLHTGIGRHALQVEGVLLIVSNSGICRWIFNQIFHERQDLQCLKKACGYARRR